jgi:uncharacterized protein YcbK (DUF882 family)
VQKKRNALWLRNKRIASTGVLAIALGALTPATTQTAIANGDTRTLSLYHTHTRESIEITYRVNGQYDQTALNKLNWFLRDWRVDEPIKMDPRLFDVVWETYRETGSREPIHIVSAYRSPKTNAMLRARSKAVAEHSQHMLGKAMDMHYTDVPMARVREIGMKLQRGGVGYYPGNGFVHLDVGSVRAWPRMSYDQLARLFPDGKTVHLASNGQPLARYEEARAELEQRGSISIPTYAEVKTSAGKGFFATLFGVKDADEEDNAAPVRSGPRSRVAAYVESRKPQPEPSSQAEPRRNPVVERAERDLPRGETFLTAAPQPQPVQRGQLVASLSSEPPPMPPRRPQEAAAPSVAPIIPLPPLRLAETTTIARPVDLPAVITGQSGPQAPEGALAYAATQTEVAAPMPQPVVRPAANRTARAAAQTALFAKPELSAAPMDRASLSALLSPTPMAQMVQFTRSPLEAARKDLARNIFNRPLAAPQSFAKAAAQGSTNFVAPAQKSASKTASALIFGQLQ